MGSKKKKKLTVVHPTFVMIPRRTKKDTKVSLNLNDYCARHHATRNDSKIITKANVAKYIKDTKQTKVIFDKPVTATFRVYKGTRRLMDKGNFYAIATKYIYDAIVELGHIPDDNDEWILSERLLETVYDKGNQRVEIIFTEV